MERRSSCGGAEIKYTAEKTSLSGFVASSLEKM